MRVVTEPKEQDGRYYFYFEYKPEKDFGSFRKWCQEPLQGPCWKAVATKVVPNIELLTEGRAGIELTDRGAGVARISGGPAVKEIHAELSILYPQDTPSAR